MDKKKKGGYGLVYQDVMRNSKISVEAKAIYAYLSSIAGVGNTCYPSIETIQKDLSMSKGRISKYMNELIAYSVVEKVRERNGNLYGRNVYKVTHEAEVSKDLKRIFRAVENGAVENGAVENGAVENGAVENGAVGSGAVENEATNNNRSNNNRLNNNSINYQQIADMYNDTCVSFPRLTKLSDSRKKAIKARLKQYNIEDFRKLFEMAECSSFLKGQNARDWSANFDWLIKDANMAKVLDGNYADRQTVQQETEEGGRAHYKSYEEFERELRESLGKEGIIP